MGKCFRRAVRVLLLRPFGLIFGPSSAWQESCTAQKPLDKAFKVGLVQLSVFSGTILKLVVEAVMITWFFMTIL